MSRNDREHWKTSILTLPDRIFFDLIHNYLGEIPSPHNKQDLLGRLEILIGKESFMSSMLGFLDEADRNILALIAWLDGSSEESLFSMVQGQDGFATFMDFHKRILSLEDRLWIYQARPDKNLCINPLVAGLVPHEGPAIQGSGHEAGSKAPRSWLGDSFLAAFIAAWPQILASMKADGTLGKRGKDLMGRLFAGLGDFEMASDMDLGLGDLCTQAFLRLGLARMQGGSAELVDPRLADFFNLPRFDRLVLFSAAAAYPVPDSLFRAESDEVWGPNFQSTGLIRDFATVLREFLELTPPGPHSMGDLVRLWHTAYHKLGARTSPQMVDRSIRILASLGIFEASGAPEPHYRKADLSLQAQRGTLTVNTAGDVHLDQNPDMPLLLPLLGLMKLERFGTDSLLRFDAETAKGKLGNTISAREACGLLERASGHPVPEALAFQLRQWEEEASGLKMQPGYLVEVSAFRTAEVMHLIREEGDVKVLGAQSIFIPKQRQDLLQRFCDGGIISAPLLAQAISGSSGSATDLLPPLRPLDMVVRHGSRAREAGELSTPDLLPAPADRQELVKELRGLIAAKPWTDAQKEEATQRVFSGLIIHAEQLSDPPRPSEQGRAQGLDFNAKVRLLDEAIKNRNEYVLVRLLGSTETTELTVWPKQVKGQGPDALLVGTSIPEHKDLILYVRKMIEVRRIRASLFV